MLDFGPVFNKTTTLGALVADLTPEELGRLTNEVIDRMLGQITDCTDADVTFVPTDPQATATSGEETEGWSLAHIIAHTTATSEENAFLAAELARGVELHGRSRYEVPFEQITTATQCRQRLEESRRMRLATLRVWPDQPHLDTTDTLPFLEGPLTAVARFALGLMHDSMHIGHIAEVVLQAQAARR